MLTVTLEAFRWWQALLLAAVLLFMPISKAIAVILVAKNVRTGIAKLAIPLILRPFSGGFRQKKKSEKSGLPSDID